MRRAALLAVLASALAAPTAASAAEFTVTTLQDLSGATCGAPCSLRQAVAASNTSVSIDGSPNVIQLPAGTLARNPAFQAPQVTAPVVIVGTGARTTTISGSPTPGFASRALTVAAAGTIDVELRDLTLANGLVEGSAAAPPQGGGIRSTGARLTLRRVSVRDNTAQDTRGPAVASSALGGGIYADRPITLDGVTVRDNRAIGTWASGNNTVSAAGGGVYVQAGGSTLQNSTIASNIADGGPGIGDGGGMALAASAQLVGVTLAGNRVAGTKEAAGGNLASSQVSPAVARATIISGGLGPAATADCTTPLTSQGGNVEDAAQCGFTTASDRQLVDPLLGPLEDDGGPTDTRALLPASPAIDRAGTCGLDVDQRGTHRPQGPACDSGAFELVVAPVSGSGGATTPAPGSGAPAPNDGAPVPSPPAGSSAPAGSPACTLRLSASGRRVRARIACDSDAHVALAATATVRRRGHRAHRVRLRPRTLVVTARTPAVMRLAMPRSVVRALRHGARASIALSADETASDGAHRRQTARIARLTLPRKRTRPHQKSGGKT